MTKHSRGRLRVFFAEFDGDDATIQEGLRAVSVAVNKTFQPRTIVKHLPVDQLAHLDADTELDESIDDGVDLDPLDTFSTSPSRSKRKPPAMSLVKDLNLRPDGKQDLRTFYDDKKPKTQSEQVTVFVYYLRQVLGIEGVAPKHVFTCFKDVGARTPNDLPQIIRNTAARKAWVDCSDANAIEVTTHGQNMVDHDLPKNGS